MKRNRDLHVARWRIYRGHAPPMSVQQIYKNTRYQKKDVTFIYILLNVLWGWVVLDLDCIAGHLLAVGKTCLWN
jgi:hypothetical protein